MGLTNFEQSPIIYGLDMECRSLCAQSNDQLTTSRFFVGTQTLASEQNQIHLLEHNEEYNSISKLVFRHKQGEVWHMISMQKEPQNLITCYSSHDKSENG